MTLPTSYRSYYWPTKREGLQDLSIQTLPLQAPNPTEVLVKVHAVSPNFRDLMIAAKLYPVAVKDDCIVASDMAGSVVAVGADVKKFSIGQRVSANFCLDHIAGDITEEGNASALGAGRDGVLTEYRLFPEHGLVPLPDHLTYEEGSTLPCAANTAYFALNGPVPVKAGDTVLLQGTGGVSLFALQFALAAGAITIITSSSDNKLEVAKSLGAHHLINYNKTPDWDKEVLKITDNRGVDHVVDVGGSSTLVKSCAAVRLAGQVHVVGALGGLSSQNQDIALTLVLSGVTLRGVRVGAKSNFESMNRLIAAHKIRPVINKVFEFDEAKEAFEYYQAQKHIGNVVIRVAKE